jgi:hypothetical protein
MADEPENRQEAWEDNGASTIVVHAALRIAATLEAMTEETECFQQKFVLYGEIDSAKIRTRDGQELAKYYVIYRDMFALEIELSCHCRTAILMAAIAIESEVNRFLFFNVGEETTESIERLSVEDKLILAHKILGLTAFKGTKPYQAVVEIMKWRNKFAHGKIPDMPGRNLHAIHVESAGRYKSPGSELADAIKLLGHYLVIRRHIDSMEKGRPGPEGNGDVEAVEAVLRDLKKFNFTAGHGVVEGPIPRSQRPVRPPPVPRGMKSASTSS